MKHYKFEAVLIEDDERTGYKAGKRFNPKGLYYQKNKVILVGDVEGGTARLAFPEEIVDVTITEVQENVKQEIALMRASFSLKQLLAMVKVISCSNKKAWYYKKIGQVFPFLIVEKINGVIMYGVKPDSKSPLGYIKIEDGVIVE
jgi:hypothetical protein